MKLQNIILTTVICTLLFQFSNAQKNSTALGTYKFDVKQIVENSSTIYKHDNTGFIYFKADYDLDADGSPRAYNPSNTGILHNGNATNSSGDMSESVVLYKNKKPYIQKASDPFPGYYISLTTLQLQSFPDTSVKRYVNPETIPYFVLPGGGLKAMGVEAGDIGIVYNYLNNKSSFAIFADSGPSTIVGEGSIALATKLGIKTQISKKGRIVGGIDSGDILYIVFPKSGKGKKSYADLSLNDIELLGKKAVKKNGGADAVLEMIKGLIK
jgi:Fungal chitosanase of glycosyl hydrolase group 75